jgi:L-seryl-tRNA(Ser) seleniumtransferase
MQNTGGRADIRRRLGIRPVINLTGTLTTMGGISARAEAIEAAASIMAHGVDIVELQACASHIIASVTGAEAGFVAACSSAGLCMAVAGAMTGDDPGLIERLPDTRGLPNEVVIQTGHLVNYGHPLAQDIRLTGARVVAVGDVNAAKPHQLQTALGLQTAAGLYVVSHHCTQHGQIAFADFVRICHEHTIPVIVDHAAEYALHAYLQAGADITVHSSHKFLGGPTAGIVCGNKALVRAAFLQNSGIGRPMKVGKEGIAGALVALESWAARDQQAARQAERETLEYWRERLSGYAGITASIDPDPTGNPFERLKVAVDAAAAAGMTALDIVWRLESGNPPIVVRTHQLEHGYFIMDPRSLGEGELTIVADRLDEILSGRDDAGPGPADVHAWRRDKARALREWPDGE